MDLDYASARACALHYNLLAAGATRKEAETALDELYTAFAADELEEPSAVSAGVTMAQRNELELRCGPAFEALTSWCRARHGDY